MDAETQLISDQEIELNLLLDAIFLKYHYDFRDYQKASIFRRVNLALDRFNCKSITALADKVIHESDVFTKLLQYLTVPTSEMFRDPTYFKAIREKVVPILRTYPSLRIWIAGCSTGEEIYTFAILLKEEGLLDNSHIYATDINPHSLERAKDGIYSIEDIQKYSKNYLLSGGKTSLSDHYVAQYEAVQMDRTLIKNVVFADHSLATDTVFAEMQFISCRNVMIYFNRELQDRAVGLFKDSLCHQCFLGIGSKESLRFSQHAESFEAFVPEEKIYRRKT